ncbi:MAG: DUF1697 domain-containing protein [Anaerolineales bacterium]|nr:DUF1697 domain-containing protein [Anaerolineales bacterium]
MITYISLLRGINVSGKRRITMEELVHIYQALNFTNVETYLQSGNVVFESTEQDKDKLTHTIEAEIENYFGSPINVFVRNIGDFARIVAGNPFTSAKHLEPVKIHVTFLYNTPPGNVLAELKNPNEDGDEFFVVGRKIYIYCPNGYGRTKLSNNFLEGRFDMPATTRNWKTVKALYEIAKMKDLKINQPKV